MTETGESLTSPPMTMVPVRSLTTTLAGERARMERFCTREMRMGTEASPRLRNIDIDTVAVDGDGHRLAELGIDRVSDIARGGKVGVEQQQRDGVKASEIHRGFAFYDATIGDTPNRGMVDARVLPPLPSEYPPMTSGPCASAYTWPLAARRAVSSSTPPTMLLASPTEETVTSTLHARDAQTGEGWRLQIRRLRF